MSYNISWRVRSSFIFAFDYLNHCNVLGVSTVMFMCARGINSNVLGVSIVLLILRFSDLLFELLRQYSICFYILIYKIATTLCNTFVYFISKQTLSLSLSLPLSLSLSLSLIYNLLLAFCYIRMTYH
jgi:hypothetical protein